jgi:hypothetical protein
VGSGGCLSAAKHLILGQEVPVFSGASHFPDVRRRRNRSWSLFPSRGASSVVISWPRGSSLPGRLEPRINSCVADFPLAACIAGVSRCKGAARNGL